MNSIQVLFLEALPAACTASTDAIVGTTLRVENGGVRLEQSFSGGGMVLRGDMIKEQMTVSLVHDNTLTEQFIVMASRTQHTEAIVWINGYPSCKHVKAST